MAPERFSNVNTTQLRNASSIFPSTVRSQMPVNISPSNQPPPIPPRQPVQSYSAYNGYQPYSNIYGNYGYGSSYRGYGSFGGYSPFSSMNPGYNYNGYNGLYSGDAENRFVQYAEESTRSTFQVIETILQTFSSITMMLDSTYFALNSSFRAILSVADNMSRLRSTVGQLLSTFALIRFLKWMYRKVLQFLGMRIIDQNEELWRNSVTETANEYSNEQSNSSPWTGILLVGSLFVIPYLINKLLNNVRQLQTRGSDPKEWLKCQEPVFTANVLYDFCAASQDELSLKCGQKIWLAPQSLHPKNLPGWWKASDGTNVGLIPSNYVTIVGQLQKKSDNKPPTNLLSHDITNSSTIPSTDDVNNQNLVSHDIQSDTDKMDK